MNRRVKIKILFAALVIFGINSLNHARSIKPQYADSVYINAKAYTMDSANLWVEAIAISEGVISYVGDIKGTESLIGRDTHVIDLAGKMLLPGFIDTHAHPLMAAGQSKIFTLDQSQNIEQWLDTLQVGCQILGNQVSQSRKRG